MEERNDSPNGQTMPSAKPFQLKKEKSTAILLAIIVVFLACHLLRFIVQVYEVVSSPLHGGHKLFQVSTCAFALKKDLCILEETYRSFHIIALCDTFIVDTSQGGIKRRSTQRRPTQRTPTQRTPT